MAASNSAAEVPGFDKSPNFRKHSRRIGSMLFSNSWRLVAFGGVMESDDSTLARRGLAICSGSNLLFPKSAAALRETRTGAAGLV